MRHPILIEKCPCGSKDCKDWHIVGFGKFVQGSGFSRWEAETLVEALGHAVPRTVETAVVGSRILVWVRESVDQPGGKKKGGWWSGYCTEYDGQKYLYAHGFAGNWDIPFWREYPADHEEQQS